MSLMHFSYTSFNPVNHLTYATRRNSVARLRNCARYSIANSGWQAWPVLQLSWSRAWGPVKGGGDVPNLIEEDEVLPNQTVASSNLGRQIICAWQQIVLYTTNYIDKLVQTFYTQWTTKYTDKLVQKKMKVNFSIRSIQVGNPGKVQYWCPKRKDSSILSTEERPQSTQSSSDCGVLQGRNSYSHLQARPQAPWLQCLHQRDKGQHWKRGRNTTCSHMWTEWLTAVLCWAG